MHDIAHHVFFAFLYVVFPAAGIGTGTLVWVTLVDVAREQAATGVLKDMPRVDHRIKVSPEAKPVGQKKRSLSAQKNNFIKTEVQHLIDAGIIRELKYPKWLSNVVIATKEGSDKLRMCIDFRNINDACPKDSYPLPPID